MKKIFTTVLLSVFTLAIFAQADVLPPQLNSPDDGKTSQMPDVLLDWYATAGIGVITYVCELDLDENFSSPSEFTVETSSAVMENLNFGDTYFWRVKASDESGEESDWSEVFSFTTINRFDISKPDDGEIDSPPDEQIKWKTNYTGTMLSGVSFMDCVIDTTYFWQKTNQAVSDENFLGVSCIDGKSLAVGEGGAVLYYDGMQWAEQESNTGDDLFCVSFVDENNGWAAGEGGTIIYFNGTEWSEGTSNVSEDLLGMYFVDANNGWAVGTGGVVIYYNGTEWAEQTSATSDDLYGVSFVDANNGWAAGDGGTIVYFNGTEWSEESSPVTKDLFGIDFVDASNGWVAGKSGAIAYYDGSEWTEQESETNMDLFFITAVSATEVWSGGEEESGMVEYNGVEWLEVTAGTQELLNASSVFSDDFGFMVGENGTIMAKNADAFSSPISQFLTTHADSAKIFLSELYFGKDYYFKIRGRHSEDTSAWSSISQFTTIAKPVNVAPESGVTNQSLDLLIEWEEISGTYEYIYELCSDPEFSYSCTGYSETNSFVPQGLLFGETYYWHIKARHSADTTDWSETWNFTVVDQLTHISPADGSHVTDIFATLEWEEVTGVNGYYVQYADNEALIGADVTKVEDPEQTTFIVPEVLEDGETFYWNVRAYIAGDTTEWSSPWSFIMGGVGVNELLTANNISIYPNPTQGLIFVELNAIERTPLQIKVSNLLGEILIEEDYTAHQGLNTHRIDLENFGTGIYMIQMQSGNEVFTQRVVIDK